MSALRLTAFDGLIPRMSPTLMSQTFSQIANNVKLYSKELRYWRGPTVVYTPPNAAYQTLYRLFNRAGASAFLLWTTDVNVVMSPLADTTGEARFYYTGDGVPKQSNYAMATGGAEPYPSASMPLGLTPPPAAPALALTVSGTGTVETRAYVYTNIQTFGSVKNESAPSPPTSIDIPELGSTVTVSGFSAPVGVENITSRRIYRTVPGATTVTYQFVAEIAVGTASYADALTVAQLGEVLPSEGWLPPPADLANLLALPGGALVGFSGNTVWFSEPYHPHAWPPKYAITLPVLMIVGLGVVGSSVVAMSGTYPTFIHGGDPGSMYTEKIPLPEPCVYKSTIASDEDGIIYASPNGLVLISPDVRGIVTSNLFTADEWRPLIPLTMKATILQGRYFGVFPNQVPSKAIVLSRTDPPALSNLQLPAIALHTDARNGLLFYVNDTDHKVYQLDADETTPLDYEWKSKRFLFEGASTYSLMRMDADYDQLTNMAAYDAARAAAIAWNNSHFPGDLQGALNSVPINTWDLDGSILVNLPPPASSRTIQVVLYGDDGDLMANLSPGSLDPIRIPPFKSRELEVSILGNIDVRSLHMATTIEELMVGQ
jgi:hypothetical protein